MTRYIFLDKIFHNLKHNDQNIVLTYAFKRTGKLHVQLEGKFALSNIFLFIVIGEAEGYAFYQTNLEGSDCSYSPGSKL